MFKVYSAKGCSRCEVFKRWITTTDLNYEIILHVTNEKIDDMMKHDCYSYPIIEKEDGSYIDGIEYMNKYKEGLK